MGIDILIPDCLLGLGNFYPKGRNMTRQDIFRMAQETELINKDYDFAFLNKFTDKVERFAALVRADERKAAAKDWEAKHGYDKHGVAAAIRARGNT